MGNRIFNVRTKILLLKQVSSSSKAPPPIKMGWRMGSSYFDTLGASVTFQFKKKRINLLLMEKKEYTCLLANADTTYASCVMNVFYGFSKEAITRTIDIEC